MDASALIAFLRKEKGHEKVARTLTQRECVLSAVTRTELLGKLVGSGALEPLGDVLEIVPFDLEQSDLAAFWYARRKPYSLSLGDCVCIALAEARGLEVLTAESAWAKLPNLRVKVNTIR
ncbi:MAG: PIN domain-containing protein [Meiothermus silvanus]|nr:PIN domain-containing protein [Allomeiothermus silvanus]